MVTPRVPALFAAMSAAAVLLAGCSGDPEPQPQQRASTQPAPGSSADGGPGGAAGSSGSPAASKKQLLGKPDLPQGAKLQDLRLDEFVMQNVGLLERVITEPAPCAGLLKTAYQASGSDKQGVATTATVGSGQIVQTLGKADPAGIAALRKVTKRCANIKSTVDELSSTASYRTLDTSKLDADSSAGMRVSSTVDDTQQTTRSVQIFALKGDLGVSLTISGDTGVDPIRLANAALAKLG